MAELLIMYVEVLGIAQDGGIPHLGCNCQNCKTFSFSVASILLRGKKQILVDATPDIVRQIGYKIPDGIIITHLHIGHYIGLLQLGKEVAGTSGIPVYATPPVCTFLRNNKPFSYLVERENIELAEIRGQLDFGDFKVDAFQVPHRNEDADTIGLNICGKKNLVYIPDIDYTDAPTIKILKDADIVLYDGTFYGEEEISRQEQVPHPPILETMQKIGSPKNAFFFTHLNHTNPLIDPNALQRKHLETQGFRIASQGQVFQI